MNESINKHINKNFFKERLMYFYCTFAFIISLYIIGAGIYSMGHISSSQNYILVEMNNIVKQINTIENNDFVTKEYINDKVSTLENQTIFDIDYDISTTKEGYIFNVKADIRNEDIFFLFKLFFIDMSFKSQEYLFITNGKILKDLVDPFI